MNDDFNSKLKKIHDNVYQWASSELNRELVGRDGGDKYTEYSYEEFERDLISLIKSEEAEKIRKAKDEVLDELLEWYEMFPDKPFNWFGAIKALKVSKNFTKPFVIFRDARPTTSEEDGGKKK